MKTMIAPNHLHATLRKMMMNQNKTQYLVNWRFFNIDQFLKIDAEHTNFELESYTLLSKLNLTLFNSMISYPSFIQSLLKVVRLCHMYCLDFESLPQSNPSQLELKSMLITLSKLPLKERYYQAKLAKISSTTLDEVYLYPDFLDPFTKGVYDLLLSRGATLYPKVDMTTNVSLKKALNPRIEIESIAQDIINRDLNLVDIQLVVTHQDYFAVIKQIFDRYNLPYQILVSTSKQSRLAKYFVMLYQFAKTPTLESLINLVKDHVFLIPNSADFLAYLDLCVTDLTDVLTPFRHYQSQTSTPFKQSFLKDALALETKAIAFQTSLLPLIEPLLSHATFVSRVEKCFDIIKQHAQKEEIHLIKKHLEAHFNLVSEENEHLFFSSFQELRFPETRPLVDGIIVSTIQKPLPCCKYRYVVGLDQENYPGFASFNGYFDEDYFKAVGFYSEQERYDLYLSQLEWIFNHCQELMLSYSFADYKGKSKELSYHIEKRVNKKAIVAPCIQNDKNSYHQPTLDKQLARNIYLEDQVFSANVYKIEQFFNCPYKHYLTQALKLRKTYDLYDFNRIKGVINHEVLRTLINQKQKNYPDTSKDNLLANLDIYYQSLIELFPTKQKRLTLFKQQNLDLLRLNLYLLNSFEKSSAFIPSELEKRFEHHFKYRDITLKIVGVIDRIDYYEEAFRIIDYKSSAYTVNLDAILAGLKLQLATYLYCLYLKDTKKVPSAFMYYSFSQSSKSYQTYTKSLKDFKLMSEEDLETTYFKANKFNGIAFNGDDSHGDKQFVSFSKISDDYDVLELFKDLDEIYTHYLNQVLAGVIDITPVKGACEFCDYQTICRFAGQGKTPVAIFTKGDRR